MTKDKIGELIGLCRRVAKARVEEAEEAGDSIPLRGLCEWKAATALKALQAENERLRDVLQKSEEAVSVIHGWIDPNDVVIASVATQIASYCEIISNRIRTALKDTKPPVEGE